MSCSLMHMLAAPYERLCGLPPATSFSDDVKLYTGWRQGLWEHVDSVSTQGLKLPVRLADMVTNLLDALFVLEKYHAQLLQVAVSPLSQDPACTAFCRGAS